MKEFVLTDDAKKMLLERPPNLSTLIVEKGHVQRFAESIGDDTPVYFDIEYAKSLGYKNIIAPPTFLRCMDPAPPNPSELIQLENILDGGSEWEYIMNVFVGDTITSSTIIKSVTQRNTKVGTSVFVIGQTSYSNQDNVLIATQKFTYIKY